MKKLLLLFAILAIGCSKEEQEKCECSTVLDRDNVEYFEIAQLCDAEQQGWEVDYSKGIPIVTNKSGEQLQAAARRNGCR